MLKTISFCYNYGWFNIHDIAMVPLKRKDNDVVSASIVRLTSLTYILAGKICVMLEHKH